MKFSSFDRIIHVAAFLTLELLKIMRADIPSEIETKKEKEEKKDHMCFKCVKEEPIFELCRNNSNKNQVRILRNQGSCLHNNTRIMKLWLYQFTARIETESRVNVLTPDVSNNVQRKQVVIIREIEHLSCSKKPDSPIRKRCCEVFKFESFLVFTWYRMRFLVWWSEMSR